MEEVATLEIADITASRPSRSRAMPEETPARLLSLDGRWFGCQARHYGGALLMSDAEEVTRGGMSGSPILREGADVRGEIVRRMSIKKDNI